MLVSVLLRLSYVTLQSTCSLRILVNLRGKGMERVVQQGLTGLVWRWHMLRTLTPIG